MYAQVRVQFLGGLYLYSGVGVTLIQAPHVHRNSGRSSLRELSAITYYNRGYEGAVSLGCYALSRKIYVGVELSKGLCKIMYFLESIPVVPVDSVHITSLASDPTFSVSGPLAGTRAVRQCSTGL